MSLPYYGALLPLERKPSGCAVHVVGFGRDDGSHYVAVYAQGPGFSNTTHVTPATARELAAQLIACADALDAIPAARIAA